MKEILPHIYFGTIPAEEDSQNDVNIYMIHDRDQSLFIDCGYDTQSSLRFFEQAFQTYDIRPEKTMLFLTHYHIDHTGMAWWFQRQGVDILMHKLEYEDARMGLSRVRVSICSSCGIHDSEIAILKKRVFDSRDYRPFFFEAHTLLGGEILEIGPYRFQTVLLRGHTRAQLGLYEASAGLLFSGDHILKGITPVILTEKMDQHFLDTYYRDLLMVSSLKVSHLFPAHSEILSSPDDVDAVIRDTKISYSHLCNTVMLILRESPRPMTAYQITLKLYHRQRTEMRKNLGLRQYLMTQKILSCLEYLYDRELASRTIQKDGALTYDLIPEAYAAWEGIL